MVELDHSYQEEFRERKVPSTFSRVLKYTLNRGISLSIAVVFGVFLSVVVTNFGGFVDNIYLDRIKGMLFAASNQMIEEEIPLDERIEQLNDLRWQLEENMGIHTPFFERCIRWTADALTFGFSRVFAGYKTPSNFVLEKTRVIETVLKELPGSLLLFGTAMIPAFLISVWTALYISRRPGNWLDRLMVTLTPISSVPSWVLGVILTTIFAIKLFILPERGYVSPTTDMTRLEYIASVGKHLLLPALSIIITSFFQSVYSWRTYFLLQTNEDYVDLAVAKGLSNGMLERKYILRPTMPLIITNFSLLMMGFWQEIIALEVWFDWPGIGKLFIQAIQSVNSAVAMSIVVIFAYLFVILVFLLDIFYAILDPRVQLGENPQRERTAKRSGIQLKRTFRIKAALLKQFSRSNFAIALAAGSIGIGLGLLLGWCVWTGSSERSSPAELHPGYQMDYMQLVIDSFNLQEDQTAASIRIAGLANDAPGVLNNLVNTIQDPFEKANLQYFAQNYTPEDLPPQEVPRRGGLEKQQLWTIAILISLVVLMGLIRFPPQLKMFARSKGRTEPGDWQPLGQIQNRWRDLERRAKLIVRELKKYPSAIVGLTVIVIMIGIGILTLVTVPQQEAIELWRSHSRDSNRIPQFAPPVWTNWFRKAKLPTNQEVTSIDGNGLKTTSPTSGEGQEILIELPLDYQFVTFPQDVSFFLYNEYDKKAPFVKISWITPDGREIKLISEVVKPNYQTRLSFYIKDSRHPEVVLAEGNRQPMEFLFADPIMEEPTALRGVYTLRIEGITFEKDSDIDAELVLLGQVYGIAGSDHYKRDLGLALGWGILVALAFGLIGAVSTSFLTMLLAAIGTWFGGWVDNLIQRLTEINMMMPVLPLAITVYFVYAKTIWAILGAVVLLSIFGKEIKNYRSVFLQMKQEVYIEAAKSYGASDWRIITHYLVPRIFPLMVPRLIILVPGYVFLEATFAFLGAPDEYLPTLGKVIYEAFTWDALKYHLYWFLIPLAVLIILGISFAMVGLALDRILNPKMREI